MYWVKSEHNKERMNELGVVENGKTTNWSYWPSGNGA